MEILLLLMSGSLFVSVTCLTPVSQKCGDVKLMTFTTPGQLLLSGLPFTGPAVNLAIREVHQQYGVTIANVFMTRKDLNNCDDMMGALYLIPEFYYRESGDTCFVLLNPGCDDQNALGQLSSEWNIPIFISGTTYPVFYDGITYPTLTSFGGADFLQLTQALLDILRYFLWISVAVVHDVSSSASSVYPTAVKVLKDSGSSYVYSQFTFFPIDTGNKTSISYPQILAQIQPISRVVVFLARAEHAREFLINLQQVDKSPGEYVVICAEPFRSLRRLGDLTWKKGDNDDQVARIAFRSLLHLTSFCGIRGRNPEQQVLDTIKLNGIAQYNASYLPNEETNEVAMSTYYSVKALGEVLSSSDTRSELRNGRTFAGEFSNRTFTFNRRRFFMNSARIRLMDYCLRDLDVTTGELEPVMAYNAATRKLSLVASRTIDWPTEDGQPPLNVPKCGFMGGNPVCQEQSSWSRSSIATLATPLVLVFLFCLALFIRRQGRHLHMAKDDHWWLLDDCDFCMKFEASKVSRPSRSGFSITGADMHDYNQKMWERFPAFFPAPAEMLNTVTL